MRVRGETRPTAREIEGKEIEEEGKKRVRNIERGKREREGGT